MANCVKREQAKMIIKKRFFIIVFLIICLLLLPIIIFAQETTTIKNNENLDYYPNVMVEYKQVNQKVLDNTPEIGCKAFFIADPNTGKVFYEKNAHEKMYPASTTKILTALVVIEKCQLEEKATVSQNAIDLVPSDYSNARLKAGEELSISDLLYALLIPSANEAANVLAEHVSGSISAFADLCNNRAKELGCKELHFVNSNGIHDENHYCSAYDLYLIAKECRKHDIFNKIVKTKSFTLPATNIYPKNDRTFANRNEMLLPGIYYYSNCTGIKTGHTSLAGECFVGSSSFKDIDLISIALGGKEKNSKGLNDRFYDTRKLYDFVYDNYSIEKIAEYGQVVSTIDVKKATKETASLDLIVDTDISAIIPNNVSQDNISFEMTIDENIVAPIEKNQVLGQITYNADGMIYKTNIIASHSVEKAPYVIYNLAVVIAVIIILFLLYILFYNINRRKKGEKYEL